MANEPVQVVMNPGAFRGPREKQPPANNGTDFFAGRDDAFRSHRDALISALGAIRAILAAPGYFEQFGGLGQVQSIMAPAAIAKSHRPQKKLFRPTRTPHVGTAMVGQPIYSVTPDSLSEVIAEMQAAEVIVESRPNSRTGELMPSPSRQRCEVSAIKQFVLWSEPDKRDFSAAEAAAWLARAATGGNYLVELFPARGATARAGLVAAQRSSLAQLSSQFSDLGVLPKMLPAGKLTGGRALTLRVQQAAPQGLNPLQGDAEGSAPSISTPARDGVVSSNADDHQLALSRIAQNPMVRSIALPPLVSTQEDNATTQMPFGDVPADVFERDDRLSYPAVGVIDGGIGGPIGSWVEESWGQLADDDKDADHGTFISGLLVAAAALNPYLRDQTAGCVLYDVDVLPADTTGTGSEFASYYPDGVIGFMDEIESAVEHFRQTRSVRIFNFSINITSPGSGSRYGYVARRLDEIAARLDVIFVISAGNLEPSAFRREWDPDPATAIAELTSDRTGFLSEPGESLFNTSVSALNPPGMPGQVPFALARYSRRGPGLRGAVKPDFSHIGGSGTESEANGTGLFSLNEDGRIVSGAGTSYAAPLVARHLADLDNLIDGDVPREMLLAMLVHHARRPEVMGHKNVFPASRNLIGFGLPVSAQQMLQSGDSEITLVVNSTIQPREQAKLDFAWPPSLVRNGKCRGYARLTLVARPVIAYEHGDERLRVNVDAKLMQEQNDGGYANQLTSSSGKAAAKSLHPSERELLGDAMKWQIVKTFDLSMSGRGPSSNWRFFVEYLTRADEDLPQAGVEFCAILTIGDTKREAPVFQEMRQTLVSLGIQISDIQTSVQVRAQV